jgi:hypothetical protein
MDRSPQDTLTALRDFCAARLGPDLADRTAALARPGFGLTPAGPGAAAGRSRFGGRALLEPGTPWPTCDGFPLSLLAVLDTDALAPWLGGTVPAGTGLLNFFFLDTDSDRCDPGAFDVARGPDPHDPRTGRVVAARSDRAAATPPPARATDFAPVPWAAAPGLCLPDAFDPAWDAVDPGPGVGDLDRAMPGHYVLGVLDGERWPGRIDAEDVAFGRPGFPTGGSPMIADGDPARYHHLLQLAGQDEWSLGGDGGWMHWSIPTEALRSGDFTRALPTPDYW